MANHKRVLEHVKTHEGGYSADPDDNASRNPSPVIGLDKRYPSLPVHTYRGVTWATWVTYCKVKGIAPNGSKFVSMGLDTWEDILKNLYWDAIFGDRINSQGIAEMLFEAIWGGGAKPLIIEMQKFLRTRGYDIAADGVVGPKTVSALNNYTASDTAEKAMILYLTNERLKYLQGLSDWWKYRAGWSRRVQEMKDRALAYITENPTTTGGGIIVAAAIAAYLAGAGK